MVAALAQCPQLFVNTQGYGNKRRYGKIPAAQNQHGRQRKQQQRAGHNSLRHVGTFLRKIGGHRALRIGPASEAAVPLLVFRQAGMVILQGKIRPQLFRE